MGDIIRVGDPHDERLAEYRLLTDASARRANRIVAEGILVIRELVASAYPMRSMLVTANRLDALAAEVERVDAPIYVVDQAIMNTVAGFNIHRGTLAIAERRPLPALEDLLRSSRRLAVVEGLTDHENMGAIFRNAAAFGLDGIVLCPRSCDPLYRRSVRVSMGHVLRLPFTRAAEWPGDLDAIRTSGFELLALTPDPSAEAVSHHRASGRGRWAAMFGSEGAGLSVSALAKADRKVRIPMAEGVDSLNVATAAAVTFHQLCGGSD